MPRLSPIIIAYISHGIFNAEPCDTIKEAKNVNSFSIFHCVPPTYQHTEKLTDAQTKRKREDILGENDDNKTKLDTSITSHTYLGWTHTLTTLTSNITAICAALVYVFGRELKTKKQSAPDLCANLRHLALQLTQEKTQLWFEKHRRTNGHMPHFAATTIDNMICARAELASNPSNLRYAMTDQWHKLPVAEFVRVNDVFYAACDRFAVAASNGDSIPLTPLWNTSQQKQREDAAKKKEETTRLEQMAAQLLKQRGFTVGGGGRSTPSTTISTGAGKGEHKKQKTDRPPPTAEDRVGYVVYAIKGKMPMPKFPNPTQYHTCAGFIRTGASCRNPTCPGKHDTPMQMPNDILTLWCHHIKRTPDLSWDLNTVPPHILSQCLGQDNGNSFDQTPPDNHIETIE